MKRSVLAIAICAIGLSGCSSRPRNFAPVLSAAPADPQTFETQWLDCRDQVLAAVDPKSGRLGSAAGGAAAGASAGMAAGAAASGTYATMGAGLAAAGLAIMSVPVVGLAGAWGISKMKKNKKEKAIKTAMAACLAEKGVAVDEWRVMSRREVRDADFRSKAAKAALLAAAADPAPPAADQPQAEPSIPDPQ